MHKSKKMPKTVNKVKPEKSNKRKRSEVEEQPEEPTPSKIEEKSEEQPSTTENDKVEDDNDSEDSTYEEPVEPATKKPKTAPAVTAEEFKRDAKPFTVDFCGKKVEVKPTQNKTGSYGWKANNSHSIVVGEKVVQVQISCNVTVTGSKGEKKLRPKQ